MKDEKVLDGVSFAIGYTQGKQSAVGSGGSPAGFHKVQFFNDDRTTLLYTVFVPHGASAMYAGETPISTANTEYVLVGFEPSPLNVTADIDCYATYARFTSLNDATWEQISQVSAEGTAQNYFAVGDTKMIHIEGTVGAIEVDGNYGVYIIGFDHNEELEGKGIHFGTFKSSVSNGIDLCLHDPEHNSMITSGEKYFNMNHYGASNYGGWKGCDLRYDILGSTDVKPSGYGGGAQSGRNGYDASETCATNPVVNTLMAALPYDLRAVMKPMTKYTDNKGGGGINTTTISTDYLPLLSTQELTGDGYKQKQYAYYAEGNSKLKYSAVTDDTAKIWWLRSPTTVTGNYTGFDRVGVDGAVSTAYASAAGPSIAPIFKV